MLADNQYRLSDSRTPFLGCCSLFFELKSFGIEAVGPSNISCGQRDNFDGLKTKRGSFHSRPFLLPHLLLINTHKVSRFTPARPDPPQEFHLDKSAAGPLTKNVEGSVS